MNDSAYDDSATRRGSSPTAGHRLLDLVELNAPDGGDAWLHLSNGSDFRFRKESWPLLCRVRSTRLDIQVRRSDVGHLVYGARNAHGTCATTGLQVDVFMTDLLIALRAAAIELKAPRLLERLIDALPSEEWRPLARVEDAVRRCAIAVRVHRDGRPVVYGGITDATGQRANFRVSSPMEMHLFDDVRMLASELRLSHLGQQLLEQLAAHLARQRSDRRGAACRSAG